MQAAGYLVVSQGVETLPVIVDLRGDILVLKDDASHPALSPFCQTHTFSDKIEVRLFIVKRNNDVKIHLVAVCSGFPIPYPGPCPRPWVSGSTASPCTQHRAASPSPASLCHSSGSSPSPPERFHSLG